MRIGARRTLWACLLSATALLSVSPAASARQPAGFWQKSFRSWEAHDRKHPPPKGGVVFVGSSSIRMWPTAASFPRLPALNRGLGGAHIDDVEHFVERLVLSYEPKVVVFYAGENDIGAGATPERVLTDFRGFVTLVRDELPQTHIVFISIKPSVVLRHLWSKVQEANRLIEELCAGDARLLYLDVASHMLDAKGKPRRELFLDDGLHMNANGYRIWTQVVAPAVESALAQP